MSCIEFQHDLLLHADGELEGEASLHLLAHLKVCPGCTKQVYAQQQLKASIGRVMGELQAPVALRSSIAGILDAADRRARWTPPGTASAARRFRTNWPIAMAAIVGLALFASWQFHRWVHPAAAPASVHAIPVTDEGPVAVELAKNVHKLHIRCATLGAAHQDSSLSHDPAQAAAQLSALLGIPVLSGQQLQLASGKARFDTAHLCLLTDAVGADHKAAHLIYRDHDGEAISLLSMNLLDEFASLKTRVVGGNAYAILEPGVSTKCHPFTVVAWSGKQASYVVCSPFGYDETMASVEPLRLALDRGEGLPLYLASCGFSLRTDRFP